MSDNDFFASMYGGPLRHQDTSVRKQAEPSDKFKMASRVIGGMKAQNSHTKTLDIDGELHTFPKAEYVSQLETQLREARQQIRDLQTKQQRLIKNNNRIMDKIRQIEMDLANKIDLK